MKKVLAFVLALAMVLGCFSTVFAKEFTDVAADADYATAVDVLSDLGVVSGYGDDYKPGNVVTRAEMASLLVKALGLTPSAATTTKFTDVKSADWFAGWVAYANSLGIIAGRTETIFDPNAPVSYDEAIVMIINALGYSGSLTGSYPTAYIIKAQSLGITKGVDLLGSAGAVRGDIAQLIYNTLSKEIGTTDKDGKWTATTGDTMYSRLGATVATEAVMVTPDMVEDASIDLEEYLGALIVPVVDEDGAVIAIKSVKTEWLTGKYKSSKIGTTVVLSGAFTTASAIFVNGAKVGTAVPADADTVTYKYAVVTNDDGDVKQVVSAQIWSGTPYQVSADVKATDTKIATTSVTVTLPTRTANGKTVLDTDAFELVGVASIDEIKEDNIITVYNTAAGVVKIEVGVNTVTGKITKLKNNVATINGTAYDAATGFTFDEDAFDDEWTFYLDFAGEVFFAEAVTGSSTKSYAVLLDSAETAGSWKSSSSSWQVKLLTADGKTEAYAVDLDTVTEAVIADTHNFNEVYEVKFDEDNTLIALTPVVASGFAASDAEVNAKGALAGKYFASDAVIFTYELEDGEYTWSVLDVAKIAGVKVPGAGYVLKDGKITLLCAEATEADAEAVKGVYVASTKISSSKYEVTFMVDGKETTYTTTKTFTFDGAWGKITFSGAAPQTLTMEDTTSGALYLTDDAAVASGSFTADGTDYYALDGSIMVYVVDLTEETVTVGSTADMIDEENNAAVVLYDIESTPDDVYEVAVVYVK